MTHRLHPLLLAVLIGTGGALAACSPGPNGLGGHAITFDNNSVVLHAPGHPAAHIDNDGDLRIGGKAIDLTPAQQDVLKTYYGQAVAVAAARSGTDLHVAARAVKSTLRDAFGGKHAASSSGKGTTLAGVQRMCRDVAALNATQARAAAEIAAFAPYASASTGIHCDAAAISSTSVAPAPAATTQSGSFIDDSINAALARAQRRLKTHDITISGNDGPPNRPEAKITPRGDLLIAGKPVPVTPAQRSLLLAYRAQIVSIGEAGIAVGRQGAELGLHAAGTAIAAALSGESNHEIQQKVQAQTAGIRQSAAKLCDRMPALMAEQKKLAAALPAFRPYATMTQKNVDDCRTDALQDDMH